jgi:4-amino-4-deoxychorismate lyase
MSRFVETIKLNDGIFYRLNRHQERVNKAFELFYPTEVPIKLVEILNQTMIQQEGLFKCRIVYDNKSSFSEFMPYVIREIHSLRLVEMKIDTLNYKPEDRTTYNTAFAQRGECDDVLILRNGILTDSSYTNIALFDGKDWFTPKTPLIYGVNRAELIESGILKEKDILVSELANYQKIALVNAMIEFGEIVLNVDKIF